MKGLIVKELLIIYRNFMFQIVAFFAAGAIGVVGNIPSLTLFIPLIISVLSISGTTVDETSKWAHYGMMLPVSRKKIVTSKYVIALLGALASAVFLLLFMVISMCIKGEFSSEMILAVPVGGFLMGMIFPSVLLPFYLKFGATKGRIIYLTTIGLVCGITSGIMSLSNNIISMLSAVSEYVTLFLLGGIGAAVVLIFVSWLISVAVYSKKDILC